MQVAVSIKLVVSKLVKIVYSELPQKLIFKCKYQKMRI